MVAKGEKWSKIVVLVIAQVIPVVIMMPKAISSFNLFFTTNSGSDAFELTFSIW